MLVTGATTVNKTGIVFGLMKLTGKWRKQAVIIEWLVLT